VKLSDSAGSESPYVATIRTGKPVHVRDIHTDSHFEPCLPEAAERAHSSVPALSLSSDRKCLGAITVYSEEAAFDEAETDLIVTVIIMPEKEGIETIREFRRDFPDLKIMPYQEAAKR
jgi:CheY-like chemotaxis protein